MDLSFVKRIAKSGADMIAGIYATAFDAITVNRYTTTVDAAGKATRVLSDTFNTGARRRQFRDGYDVAVITGTLANKQYRKYEMANGNAVTFLPVPNDEVLVEDEAWNVVGCTPVDEGGVQVTYTLILVKK
jgi:hypothetical protein